MNWMIPISFGPFGGDAFSICGHLFQIGDELICTPCRNLVPHASCALVISRQDILQDFGTDGRKHDPVSTPVAGNGFGCDAVVTFIWKKKTAVKRIGSKFKP